METLRPGATSFAMKHSAKKVRTEAVRLPKGVKDKEGNSIQALKLRLQVDVKAFDSATRQAVLSGVFRFGFVRNPWHRLVSCYRDKIG